MALYRRLSQPLEVVACGGNITLRFLKKAVVVGRNEVRLLPHLNGFFDEGGRFLLKTPVGSYILFSDMQGVNNLLHYLDDRQATDI